MQISITNVYSKLKKDIYFQGITQNTDLQAELFKVIILQLYFKYEKFKENY